MNPRIRASTLLPRILVILGVVIEASCGSKEQSVQVSLDVSDSVTLEIIEGVTVNSSDRSLPMRKTADGRLILTIDQSEVGTIFVVKAPEYHPTSITWEDLTNRSHLSKEGLPDSRIALQPINNSREEEYLLDEMVSPGSYDVDDVSDANADSEQGGSGQPATRPDLKSEGSDKPQPEAEGRSR